MTHSSKILAKVSTPADIVAVRQQGRTFALKLGFKQAEVTLIAAAISEVARNIVEYAKGGEVIIGVARHGKKRGIRILARDEGPGIPDIGHAMQYGYSTRKGLGVGLPGTKWLMDEFDVVSQPGKGTTIAMKKWVG